MDSNEKRSARRMDISVKIKLNELYNSKSDIARKEEIEVDVFNISKYGMGFRTKENLSVDSFYDAKMILWTKEKIDTIIEIVRKEEKNDGSILYGCKFIGMVAADLIKIQIYEMFNESED